MAVEFLTLGQVINRRDIFCLWELCSKSDHDDKFARTLINKTAGQLAESLLAYCDLVGEWPAENEEEIPAESRKQLGQAPFIMAALLLAYQRIEPGCLTASFDVRSLPDSQNGRARLVGEEFDQRSVGKTDENPSIRDRITVTPRNPCASSELRVERVVGLT